MINLILGIFTGITGTLLYLKGSPNAWQWMMFLLGAAFTIFSFDVLMGSIREHEKRAATLGFFMFGIPGSVLLGLSFVLGF